MQLTTSESHFCRVLGELRYLSSEQIYGLWFADRPLLSVKRRLRKLRVAGYLRSVRRQIDGRGVAWRLGGRGFRLLRDLFGDDVGWYQDVKAQFIEHLLDTNKVWITLGEPHPVWAEIGFSWLGSHRARFEFASLERNRRQTRYVNPDALVRARGPGPRLFLELDRSTETIKERAGQRSIVGKLKAYRAAFVLPLPGQRHSAYAAKFRDGRAPRIVFVLSRDRRGKRADSIANVAQEVTPDLDVSCVQLDDANALRGLLTAPVESDRNLAALGRLPAPARAVEAAHEDDGQADVLGVAASFYKAAVLELRSVGITAHRFPELADLQRRIRQRLEKPPRNLDRLVGGEYRRFFRASLEVLEKRRPRSEWSRELVAAEREIRPILKLDPARNVQRRAAWEGD
ncbi:replication-relaxation family protein [Myxococcota bacterium]